MKTKHRLFYILPLLVFIFVAFSSAILPYTAHAAANTSTQPTVDCKLKVDSPLKWIVCPVIDGLIIGVKTIDGFINSQLTVGSDGDTTDPNQIFCDKNTSAAHRKGCEAFKGAWASVRNLALGLMVISGIGMLMAQALGMEILDAYTVRKVLPRLLVVAVAITVSWPLMQFLVQFSNDLGYGVRFIIYEPFKNFNSPILGGGAGGIASLVELGGLTLLGFMGLISFLGVAAIAALIGFIVLILRELIIIVMVIAAPIALACYILPNTQRVFKQWWDIFSKALLAFALISAIIAIGRVFAVVSGATDTDPTTGKNTSGAVQQLVGFSAYFIPYLLIGPAVIRFSGALGQVAGALQQRSRGANGFLKQYRGNQAKKNLKAARAGQRWDRNFGRFGSKDWMSIGHIANRAALNAFDQDELLPYRLGKPRKIAGKQLGGAWGFKKGSAKLQDELDNASIAQSTKAYQHIEENGGMHYEAYRALAGQHQNFKGNVADADGNDTGVSIAQAMGEAGFVDKKTGQILAPRSLKDFQKMAHIMQSSTNDKERLGGDDLERHAGYLATVKSDPEMAYADAQVAGTLGLAAAGRAEPEALAEAVNSIGERQGGGVAQRTLKTAMRVGARNRPDLRDGHGIILNPKSGKYESAYSQDNFMSDTAVGSVLSAKGSDWSGAKAEAVTAAHGTLVYIANGGTGNADDQRTVRDSIVQGIQNPYNDAGQRKAWIGVARQSGFTDEDLSRMQGRAARIDDQSALPHDEGGGAPGGAPGAGGAGGGGGGT